MRIIVKHIYISFYKILKSSLSVSVCLRKTCLTIVGSLRLVFNPLRASYHLKTAPPAGSATRTNNAHKNGVAVERYVIYVVCLYTVLHFRCDLYSTCFL